MAHPLSGANVATLKEAFTLGGRPDRWGTSAAIWAAALARAPISAIERRLIDRDLPEIPEGEAPIFILGHWRSGTTHLYNTMSRGAFGYVSPLAVGLPWDMFGIARALRPALEKALPEHRWIDRIPVTPVSPQEDEIGIASMTDKSFYHGIYFPRRFDALIDRGLFFDGCSLADIAEWEQRFQYFMRKLSRQQGKRLLIKNPVYTGRIAHLRRLYPAAKFIHIHRNPFDVFLSMRNFYRKLLDVMALQSVPAEVDLDATILRVYDRMMHKFDQEAAAIPDGHFVEIPYQELDEAPLDALAKIYASLGLEGYVEARPAFESYLESVRSFEKNAFRGDAEVIEMVASHWEQWLRKWNYTAPSPPQISGSGR